MEEAKQKRKIKGILKKTWERCKSFGHANEKSGGPLMMKSKSWSSFSLMPSSPKVGVLGRSRSKKARGMEGVVPEGCFSVYVGPDKQRFVMKVECTKHPLFKMLLEEAELEYGFHSKGPLVLPCDVNVFINVLFEMEADAHQHHQIGTPTCGFSRSSSLSYLPLTPSSASTLLYINQLL